MLRPTSETFVSFVMEKYFNFISAISQWAEEI